MSKLARISALAITFLANVTANSQDFAVSIVGQAQSDTRNSREGLPLVYCPWPNESVSPDWMNDEPSASSFLVVIQNLQNMPEKMTRGASSWYDCLEFTMTDSLGKTYHIARPLGPVWSANPMITWIFPASGFRVMPVNFTNGFWQGLPPSSREPELMTMTATFRYPDSSGNMISVSSSPTNVYWCQSPEAATAAKLRLKFVKADSQETNGEDGYGENAVDGDPNTYWHTQWSGNNSPGLPHEIILELDPPSYIKGFSYLPRQDASENGTIKDYEFYVSNDGTNFGDPVKKGKFERGKGEKIETFNPVWCRFVKLKAISEINGLPWTSAAEIRVIERGDAAFPANYWRGDIGPAFAPQDSATPNAIDSFVATLSADGDLWLNGIDRPNLLAARSPEGVVEETLPKVKFDTGMLTSFHIVDIRKVQIGQIPGTYTAVLINTNLGQMIALMNFIKGHGIIPGHWWLRIYDAHPPIHRLY
jgi:F5/8 type C domain